jgi:hypothetical protein
MIEEKIRAHNSELHECGKALICRIFAGRSLEKESEYREVINILFEALYVHFPPKTNMPNTDCGEVLLLL